MFQLLQNRSSAPIGLLHLLQNRSTEEALLGPMICFVTADEGPIGVEGSCCLQRALPRGEHSKFLPFSISARRGSKSLFYITHNASQHILLIRRKPFYATKTGHLELKG